MKFLNLLFLFVRSFCVTVIINAATPVSPLEALD